MLDRTCLWSRSRKSVLVIGLCAGRVDIPNEMGFPHQTQLYIRCNVESREPTDHGQLSVHKKKVNLSVGQVETLGSNQFERPEIKQRGTVGIRKDDG